MELTLVLSDFRAGLAAEIAGFSPRSPQARAAARAALACLAAVFAAMWLETENIYWAGITAIVVTRPNLGSSLAKGVNRLVGTLAGGFLGYLAVGLFSQNRVLGLAFVFSMSAATVLASADRGRDRYAFVMAGFTSVVVFLGSLSAPENAYHVAFFRVFDIGLGVVAAWCVNALAFPAPAGPLFADRAGRVRDLARDVGRQALRAALDAPADPKDGPDRADNVAAQARALARELAGLRELFQAARMEGAFDAPSEAFFRNVARYYEEFAAAAAVHVRRIARLPGPTYQRLFRREARELSSAFADLGTAFAKLAAGRIGLDQAKAAAERLGRAAAALDARYDRLRQSRWHFRRHSADVLALIGFLRVFARLPERYFLDDAQAERRAGDQAERRSVVAQSLLARQALCAGLAMVATPLLWIWLDLPGLTEIAISALIVLQPGDLETVRKGALRLAGCLVGGAAGLLLLGFLPMADPLPWTVVYGLLLFLFGYVNFGDPRCAYAGLQACLALTMSLVQDNGPAVSLSPPLERLGAILAAVCVMNAILILTRPRRADDLWRRLLAERRELVAALFAALAARALGRPAELAEPAARLLDACRASEEALEALARLEDLAREEREAGRRLLQAHLAMARDFALLARTPERAWNAPPPPSGILRVLAEAAGDPAHNAAGIASARRDWLATAETQRRRPQPPGETARGAPQTAATRLAAAALRFDVLALIDDLALAAEAEEAPALERAPVPAASPA